VSTLAHRIAGFPAAAMATLNSRVNAIALASVDDFRHDSDLFGESVVTPEAQSRLQTAMKRGFQTRAGEMDLARTLGGLPAR